ncbi:hypothetical protein ACFLSJ_04735 [Verrucomicrobiota bacterium]
MDSIARAVYVAKVGKTRQVKTPEHVGAAVQIAQCGATMHVQIDQPVAPAAESPEPMQARDLERLKSITADIQRLKIRHPRKTLRVGYAAAGGM